MQYVYTGPKWGHDLEPLDRENLEYQRIAVIHYMTGELGLKYHEEEQMLRSLKHLGYDEEDLMNTFLMTTIDRFNFIPPSHYPVLVNFATKHGVSPLNVKVEFDIPSYFFGQAYSWLTRAQLVLFG